MSKPAGGRKRRAPSVPAVTVVMRSDSVTIRLSERAPEAARVALMVNGVVHSTADVVAEDGGRAAHLARPPGSLGGACRVVQVPGGRTLSVFEWRAGAVEWLGWGLRDGVVEGSFRLGEGAVDDLVAVDLMDGPESVHTCFALPDDGGGWRFATPLPRLPPFGGALQLVARVGGRVLGEALEIGARDCGFAGHVDPAPRRLVRGWAVDLVDPAHRVELEATVDGVPVWRGFADRTREDLKQLGLSDGHSGFEVMLPEHVPRNVALHIAVGVVGAGTQLAGSPYVLEPPPRYAGFFDALDGPSVGGWAVSMHEPGQPLEIEAVCEGAPVGSGMADLFRGDVEKAGLPTAWCGFRFQLTRPLAELLERDVYLRVKGTDQLLAGSPRQISRNNNIVQFLTRATSIPEPTLRRLQRRIAHATAGLLISIVMPVHDTRREWLVEALASVLGQWSPHWELVCVDDGSTLPHVREVLELAARHDRRVRVMRTPGNLGIARATNLGLRAARGDYVAFMDHDDVIEPDAVYKLAQAARQTAADLIYSDEVITTEDIGGVIEVRARPAFSYDYYLSHPYFVHMVCVRATVAQRVGGWDESLPISADVDFILRVVEAAAVVTHVPSVLYRWRTHAGSAGHAKQALVTETMLGVLDRHLARQGLAAHAVPGLRYNEYRVEWRDDGAEVLIVIPTKDRIDLLRACIDSIEATSAGENYRIVVIDHESTDKRTVRYLKDIASRHTVMPYSGVFNYARMNNLAVKTYGGKARYYVFLNNDVEAREAGWLPRLRSLAARTDVGAVGCLLVYGDDRVQHAGVLVGFSGAADHAMKFQEAYLAKDRRHPGYNCNLTTVRDYSAVTAACMMVPRRAWRAVGGFDEQFLVGFNDTDLCLRIGEAGFKVLYDGFTVLYHHESATRTQHGEVDHPEDDARLRSRWPGFFVKGDPFYSPLLAPRGTDHTVRQDAGCKGRTSARAVKVRAAQVAVLPEQAAAPAPARPPRRRIAKGDRPHVV